MCYNTKKLTGQGAMAVGAEFKIEDGNLYVHTQPESPMAKYVQKEYPKVTLLLDYDAKEEETL
jgi:general stress protein 26